MALLLEPLQLVLANEDAISWWEVTRRTKKSARPYGAFLRARKPDPNVQAVKDLVAGRVTKVRLCTTRHDPFSRLGR